MVYVNFVCSTSSSVAIDICCKYSEVGDMVQNSGIFELEYSLSHQGVLCGRMFCKELSSSCLYISSTPTLQVY
jgi:hypothetical protein